MGVSDTRRHRCCHRRWQQHTAGAPQHTRISANNPHFGFKSFIKLQVRALLGAEYGTLCAATQPPPRFIPLRSAAATAMPGGGGRPPAAAAYRLLAGDELGVLRGEAYRARNSAYCMLLPTIAAITHMCRYTVPEMRCPVCTQWSRYLLGPSGVIQTLLRVGARVIPCSPSCTHILVISPTLNFQAQPSSRANPLLRCAAAFSQGQS